MPIKNTIIERNMEALYFISVLNLYIDLINYLLFHNNCPSLKNLKKQLNNCNLIKTFYQHYNVQFQ